MGRKCEGNKKENLRKAEKFNTTQLISCGFSSVQFSRSIVSDSLRLRGLQHARSSCPSQTQVHWVSDAIQPSHPLSCPSLNTFNLFQHQGLSVESALLIRWPKYWSFSFSISPSNHYLGLISFKMDQLYLLADQESSPTPQFKSINSSVLSFLYSPTLTSIHDYWKNHSFD